MLPVQLLFHLSLSSQPLRQSKSEAGKQVLNSSSKKHIEEILL